MLRKLWSSILRLDARLEKDFAWAWVATRIALIALGVAIIFGAARLLVSGWPGLSPWLKGQAVVAVVSAFATALALAGGKFLDWLDWRIYDLRCRTREAWRNRGKPWVVVWENLGRLALVELRFYKEAVKRNPGLKYPAVPGTLCFANPETIIWQLLTERKPKYWLPAGAIGTMADAKALMERCVIVRKPIFVPFSSFAAISRERQQELFPKISLAEAHRRIHGKR
jgi:hypothetical protein